MRSNKGITNLTYFPIASVSFQRLKKTVTVWINEWHWHSSPIHELTISPTVLLSNTSARYCSPTMPMLFRQRFTAKSVWINKQIARLLMMENDSILLCCFLIDQLSVVLLRQQFDSLRGLVFAVSVSRNNKITWWKHSSLLHFSVTLELNLVHLHHQQDYSPEIAYKVSVLMNNWDDVLDAKIIRITLLFSSAFAKFCIPWWPISQFIRFNKLNVYIKKKQQLWWYRWYYCSYYCICV